MQPEKNPEDELLEVLGHRVPNAHRVRMLTEEIDRRNKQAAAVAKRLLGRRTGRRRCPNCSYPGDPFCGTCFGSGEVLNG